MTTEKIKISLGKIISAHGVGGLFKLQLFNGNRYNLSKYKNKLYIKSIKLDLEKKFKKGKYFVCKSSKFSSADDVSYYSGEHIWIYESELEKLNKEEYYHKDLISCEVLDLNRKPIGVVKAIYNFGAGDLLELKNCEFMIRLYDIKKENIDLKNKIIKLDTYFKK